LVDVPETGAAMDVGLKLTVTQVGWPLANKAIAELKPPETVVVIAEAPLSPRTTETEVGEAERLNPGTADPASAWMWPDPFGLPLPVTRS